MPLDEKEVYMTYTEKYRISRKPFLKYTDCLNLIGTNTKIFTKTSFNDMVKVLEKKYDSRFGPWGIPNRYVMEYLGLDVDLLRINAEREVNEQKKEHVRESANLNTCS